jgi:2-dehydro-3-deoxygluconokinase
MDYDVIVIGEVLLEISTTTEVRPGATAGLAFSGDALNQAAAAAAAGARVGLLTRVGDDAVGAGVLETMASLGIDTGLVAVVDEQNGAYVVQADPTGTRAFSYLRGGSAASRLSPEDVRAACVNQARYVLTSGITATLSESTRAAVVEARRTARNFVYDPNFRARLTDVSSARDVLRDVAPGAVVTPSYPSETSSLLDADSPGEAAGRLLEMGSSAVVVTRGAEGAILASRDQVEDLPVVPAPAVIDQTGAGDAFTGTLTARLALGDPLVEATRLGLAAASLSVGGRGGTGHVPTLTETREHLARHGLAGNADVR